MSVEQIHIHFFGAFDDYQNLSYQINNSQPMKRSLHTFHKSLHNNQLVTKKHHLHSCRRSPKGLI